MNVVEVVQAEDLNYSTKFCKSFSFGNEINLNFNSKENTFYKVKKKSKKNFNKPFHTIINKSYDNHKNNKNCYIKEKKLNKNNLKLNKKKYFIDYIHYNNEKNLMKNKLKKKPKIEGDKKKMKFLQKLI